MKRVVAVIQARLGSTRLPGKSLADIAGKPLLGHVVERMRACATIHDVVVATTAEPKDDELARVAGLLGVAVYRGSTDDVLDRTYLAARGASADIVVRATADDPFKDPGVTDQIVGKLLDGAFDYVSNTLAPSFPEGVDIEAFTMDALARAWREARLLSEREHVTPYIWKHPERFRVWNVSLSTDLSRLRWTVDYPEDLTFARAVYAELYHGEPFGMEAVVSLLARRPELARINGGVARNEGYERSLAHDRPVDDHGPQDT